MHIVGFGSETTAAIELYESVGAGSTRLGDGTGKSHVYCVRIAAGGSIGRHHAGFDQLFLAVEGSGWVEGGDGRRVPLAKGEAAVFEKGELHAKGSDAGLVAIMVQADRLEAAPS